MPSQGIPNTPDLATATTNLENALQEFQQAFRAADLPHADGPVFAALRAWRTEQARAKGLPPYIIATDAMLRAIEKAQPTDLEELAAVKGVGSNRATTYGEAILAVIAGTTPLVAA